MGPPHSELIGGRLDFAYLCNDRGYRIAVEVGTDRGLFARGFLERWTGEMLYCVDPYASYGDMPWDREADFQTAIHVLLPYADRTRLLRCPSQHAAEWLRVRDIEPEFVYIDACHSYASISDDLAIWYPRVRYSGVLAGDDFDTEHEGVMRAVTEFAERMKVEVQLTTDYNRPPSWFIEKPKV